MSTRSLTDKAKRALALTTICFVVALLAAAPDTADAQRGGPGGEPGGRDRAGGPPGKGHGHAGRWHGGIPGRWRGAGPTIWYGGFGWFGPGWGFPGGGFADAAPPPSPYSYRYLYDSPYYYPNYDSYHGFSYPYY
jgi:hypothetical protein